MVRTLQASAAALIALLATSPALADGIDLGSLAPSSTATGSLRYRWARGGLSVELHDQGARWTEAEAVLVRDGLDRLPDALLRKAFVGARIRRFYRDHEPRGLTGPRRDASATTVIERGWISFGDALFQDMDAVRVYATVTHELGHCAQYALFGDGPLLGRVQAVLLGTPGWTSISWTSAITDGLRSWNGFVSDYARTNDREDFAESVEFYWLAPDELWRVSPAKYRFVRDRVFEGLVSPCDARVADKRAIDPVVPQIARLGDTRDDPGSLVRVHGQFFMGPIDGGWNTVRYRGARALHLAVSRTQLYSWVPGIATGSAPITVTTQDGRSPQAAFEVTKPWWKFW